MKYPLNTLTTSGPNSWFVVDLDKAQAARQAAHNYGLRSGKTFMSRKVQNVVVIKRTS